MTQNTVIGIVGGGLGGLSCAYYLESLGYSSIIYEASSVIGGRVRTEKKDGFLLDRGFQVLMTSYPEVKKIVRHYELELGAFAPGANVYYQNNWHLFRNPLKKPLSIFELRKLPFVYFSDVVKMGSLYMKVAFKPENPFFYGKISSTIDFLKEEQLSEEFIKAFIKPFFGGVFIDPELKTSHGFFLWMLHFFVEGAATLPKGGMAALPKAIGSKLKKTKINLNSTVRAVEGNKIFLENGQEQVCAKIVLATDAVQTRQFIPTLPELDTKTLTNVYFTCARDALKTESSSMIYLNGMGEGPINSLAFNNHIQPTYAPQGQMLASISVIDPQWIQNTDLNQAVHEQLAKWFKTPTSAWKHLKTEKIEHALPDQTEPPPLQWKYQLDRHPDIYLCGEYVDHASINGALASGRKLAELIDKDIKRLQSE